MLTTADIWLNALLARRLAAELGGGHLLRAALRTHLATAFLLVRAKQLLRHKTRKPGDAKQRQQRNDGAQFSSHFHLFEVYP